jgi:hypothetical protein
MESVEGALRLRLVLGKFQVKAISKGLTGTRFAIDLGNSVTITIDAPVQADIRLGDLLTLYTEVLSNANPNPTPIQ